MNTLQRGFTLLELLVVVSIFGIFIAASSPIWPMIYDYQARETTKQRLQDFRTALETAYQRNLIGVEAVSTATLTLGTGTISASAVDASGRCNTTAASVAPIAPLLSSSPAIAITDGYNNAMCLLISAPVTRSYLGATLQFRYVAIVSPGNNGTIDAGTALSASGELTLAGDDRGTKADTETIATNALKLTVERMRAASNAMAAYASSRFMVNPSRDITTNYWANTNRAGGTGNFDAAGAINTSANALVGFRTSNAHAAVGLANVDAEDGYGVEFRFDNSTDAVANPENTTPAKRIPPYAVQLHATLPGGTTITQTTVSTF